MKKIIFSISICLFGLGPAFAQTDKSGDSDSLGLPGDNLDLYGVLELFKKAESMEAFEKALNEEGNQVNNLDLNNDGNVDYIRVVDQTDSGAHAITLQVPISEKETQNVAAIEIEKKGESEAHLQIVGDEDIYGDNYIVEPKSEKTGTNDLREEDPYAFDNIARNKIIIVNVWGWPVVRYIYAPRYVIWVSPWRWAYYPTYWHPWHPVIWRVHHARVVHYRAHCHRVYVHRVHVAHRVYHRHHVAGPYRKGRSPAHAGGNNHNGARHQSPDKQGQGNAKAKQGQGDNAKAKQGQGGNAKAKQGQGGNAKAKQGGGKTKQASGSRGGGAKGGGGKGGGGKGGGKGGRR